jgi:hypothetical protein
MHFHDINALNTHDWHTPVCVLHRADDVLEYNGAVVSEFKNNGGHD